MRYLAVKYNNEYLRARFLDKQERCYISTELITEAGKNTFGHRLYTALDTLDIISRGNLYDISGVYPSTIQYKRLDGKLHAKLLDLPAPSSE